ncbi:hypothetical protein RFI_39903, partial [Reticulomyxa filosa]
MEQTEKASRLEAANKGWTALKQATQTLQKNHKERSNIKQDRIWQDFEEKLAAINEMLYRHIICEKQNHEEAKEEKKEELKYTTYKGLTLQIGKKHLSCEEVEYNIDRLEKGGRLDTSPFELAADNSQLSRLVKKKIKQLLSIWKKECRRLRKSYFGLTYFTMNEAQNLIQSFDNICSLDDQHLSLLASK